MSNIDFDDIGESRETYGKVTELSKQGHGNSYMVRPALQGES